MSCSAQISKTTAGSVSPSDEEKEPSEGSPEATDHAEKPGLESGMMLTVGVAGAVAFPSKSDPSPRMPIV